MTGSNHVSRSHPSRRDILRMGLGAFLVSAVPFSWQRRSVVRRSIPVMGTIAEFAVLSGDARHAHDAITAAAAELRMVERTMSRFDPASDVGRANHLAATEGVAIREETRVVIEQALRWAEASDGAFDPCMGKALEIWDVGHRRVPPYGMDGGQPAALGRNRMERADGGESPLGAADKTEAEAGDVVVVETPGGGGFGKAPEDDK